MTKILSYNFLLLLLNLSFSSNAHAQIVPLKKGQQLPDSSFSNAYNYKANKPVSIKMTGLKGKLVILDFWGIFCEPCLEGFPKLDSLQRQFGDQIQIMTVTKESQDSVARFFKSHKAVYQPSAPFITGAKDLIKMFPHMGVPYQVWIDKTGKLLQVAEDYDFTKENIAAVLSDKMVFKDSINRPVYKETLLDTTYKDQVQFASYLVRFNQKSGLRLDGNEDKNMITANGSIIELYQRAYDLMTNGKFELLKPGRLVLDIKDSGKYINTFHGKDLFKWKDQHAYYYQLIVPADYVGNLGALMVKDLDRYFGLDAKIEKKLMPFLVLTRIGKIDKLKSKGDEQFDNFDHLEKRAVYTGATRYFTNKPYKEFSARIQSFSEYTFNKPFKDLTGYNGNIDIKFKGETLDHPTINSFNTELNKYGLDLEERIFPLQVLVLKER